MRPDTRSCVLIIERAERPSWDPLGDGGLRISGTSLRASTAANSRSEARRFFSEIEISHESMRSNLGSVDSLSMRKTALARRQSNLIWRPNHQEAEPMDQEKEMIAGISQRHIVSKALQELAARNCAGFEDVLWLMFGDDWTIILRALERRQLVRHVQTEDTYIITDEGRRVLGVLRLAGHGSENERKETAATPSSKRAARAFSAGSAGQPPGPQRRS